MDLRVALLGAGICALTGLFFAVGPGLAASRANATRVLRSGRGSSAGLGILARGLVVVQMAVALVLLTVASTALATVVRLARVDLGFSNPRAVVFDLTLPEDRYRTRSAALAFLERFTAEMHSMPGVHNVGATNVGPIWQGTPVVAIRLREEYSAGDDAPASAITQLFATPGYFRAMGIEVVAGRAFSAEDGQPGAGPTVIVSETVARSLDERVAAVVGRRVRLGGGRGETAEVIGVARDVRLWRVGVLRHGQLYEPLTERRGWFDGRLSIAIDGANGSKAAVDAARVVLGRIDPDLTLYNVVTVRDLRARYLPTERLTLAVTSVFSTVALVLSAVGLYGILGQVVASRTREVGIRVALGADIVRVRRSVFAAGLRLAVAGIGIGGAGTFLAFKVAAAVLPRQDPPSPATFAVNALVLLTVALVAAWAPARRAAAVDPVNALRAE
jgi:predicted permease